jgi:hypothetical protein
MNGLRARSSTFRNLQAKGLDTDLCDPKRRCAGGSSHRKVKVLANHVLVALSPTFDENRAHEATLSSCASVLRENRDGLIVHLRIEHSTGASSVREFSHSSNEHAAKVIGRHVRCRGGNLWKPV